MPIATSLLSLRHYNTPRLLLQNLVLQLSCSAMRTLHALAFLVLLSGCLPEDEYRCYNKTDTDRPSEPHYVVDDSGERCVLVDGIEKDGGTDAMPDAEPQCSARKPCENASRPICKEGSCVSCDENTFPDQECADRNANTPVCDPVSGACIRCADNNHCTEASASRCDSETNECAKCEDSTEGADLSCSHIEGLSYCVNGECKACESDADCPDGEGGFFVCNVLTNSCTDRAPKAREYCETCVSETDCAAGSCVEFAYEGAKDFYCLPNNSDGCKANGYPTPANAAVVIATAAEQNVCAPFGASCEAIQDFRATCALPENPGTDPEGCGRTDVGDEAYCVGKADDTTFCSVTCAVAADCPFGRDCINARQRQDLVDLAIKVCDF